MTVNFKYWTGYQIDGGLKWMVFDKSKYSLDEIFNTINEHGLLHADYSGVGGYFEEAGIIRESKTRLLVTQSFGYDC